MLAIVNTAEQQAATKGFIDKYLQQVLYKIEFTDRTFYEGWTKDTHNYIPAPPFQYSSVMGFVWLGNA